MTDGENGDAPKKPVRPKRRKKRIKANTAGKNSVRNGSDAPAIKCTNAFRYDGSAPPKCNAGNPCPKCVAKYERRQEEIAAEKQRHARARESQSNPKSTFAGIFQEDSEDGSLKSQLLEIMAEMALSANGAGRQLNIHRVTVWRWRKSDPNFDAACSQAYADGTDSLKDKAAILGMAGDARLLERCILGRDHSWRDPKYMVPNAGPKALGSATIDLDDLTHEEAAALRKIAERQANKPAKSQSVQTPSPKGRAN